MKYSLLLLFSLIMYNFVIYSQVDSVASVDHSKITLSTDSQGTPGEYKVISTHLLLDIPSLAFRVGIFKNVEFRFAAVFKQEHYTTCSNSLLIYNRQVG